jgi:hypothetical protein
MIFVFQIFMSNDEMYAREVMGAIMSDGDCILNHDSIREVFSLERERETLTDMNPSDITVFTYVATPRHDNNDDSVDDIVNESFDQ